MTRKRLNPFWPRLDVYKRQGHDYAVEHQPYAVFSSLLGVHRDNTPEDRYLMSQTDFSRQRNRMTGQLHEICEAVELQLYRWQVQ